MTRRRARKGEGGDCFDTAAHYVLEADDDDVVLVHGTVLCRTEGGTAKVGQRHWHAWVEHTEYLEAPGFPEPFPLVTCIDKSNGNDVTLPQGYFYNLGVVDDVRRYSAAEAAKMMVTTGHYGAWHDAVLHRPEDAEALAAEAEATGR